jgi:hypothetical protein
MSLFSPRRYQAPFMPVQRDSFPVRVFTAFEQAIKGALFGCRMCGNCILQETAFVCPMTCPKGLRNGLCGGATPDHCEVDPSRPCTWYVIYERSERMRGGSINCLRSTPRWTAIGWAMRRGST